MPITGSPQYPMWIHCESQSVIHRVILRRSFSSSQLALVFLGDFLEESKVFMVSCIVLQSDAVWCSRVTYWNSTANRFGGWSYTLRRNLTVQKFVLKKIVESSNAPIQRPCFTWCHRRWASSKPASCSHHVSHMHQIWRWSISDVSTHCVVWWFQINSGHHRFSILSSLNF